MSRAHRSPSRRARRAVALGLLPCALLAGCVVLPSTEEAAAGPVAPEEEPATETAAAVSVEELGAGYVHEGVNEGDEDVVLLVTYVIEEGMPLAQTDLALCDG